MHTFEQMQSILDQEDLYSAGLEAHNQILQIIRHKGFAELMPKTLIRNMENRIQPLRQEGLSEEQLQDVLRLIETSLLGFYATLPSDKFNQNLYHIRRSLLAIKLITMLVNAKCQFPGDFRLNEYEQAIENFNENHLRWRHRTPGITQQITADKPVIASLLKQVNDMHYYSSR